MLFRNSVWLKRLSKIGQAVPLFIKGGVLFIMRFSSQERDRNVRKKTKKTFMGKMAAYAIILALLSVVLINKDFKANAITPASFTLSTGDVNDTGYSVGGYSGSPAAYDSSYELEYKTWSYVNGQDDLVTYDETMPTSTVYQSFDGTYVAYWNYRINSKEHNNDYGAYETDVYLKDSGGNCTLIRAFQVNISPISCALSYQIQDSSSIEIEANISDDLGNGIVSEKYASGHRDTSYFSSAGTAFTGNVIQVSSPGLYTVYLKDSAGYEVVNGISVSTNYGQTPNIGLTQNNTVKTSAAEVNAIITDVSNLYTGTPPMVLYGASSPNVSSTTSDAPDSDAITWDWVKTNTQQQYIGYQTQDQYEFNANPGDVYIFSAWIKTTDAIQAFSVNGVCFSTTTPTSYSHTSLEGNQNIISDGQWHYVYSIVKSNVPFIDAMTMNPIAWSYTQQNQSMLVNGIRWMKIPAGQDMSTGITVKRWAYGDLPITYFEAGGGNDFTGNSFNVYQNGVVTVYAKDVNGHDVIRKIDVENVDGSITDTTPPRGSLTITPDSWTSGSVTIDMVGTDGESGVKSITTPDGVIHNGYEAEYKVSTNGTYNFTVTDNSNNTTVVQANVTNIDNMVSVTYPISVACLIDPNNSTPFLANDIPITNNSQHMNLAVSLKSVGITGGNIHLQNVAPNAFADWTKLTAEQTQSKIALGAVVKETVGNSASWAEIDQKTSLFSTDLTNPVQMGVLNPLGTGNLKLVANCGKAWTQSAIATGAVELQFSLVG